MRWSRVLIYLAVLVAVAAYLYVVEIKQKAEKQAQEERAEKMVHLEKDKLVRVDLQSAERGTIELRKPADAWVLTAPVKAKCDEAAVGSLLQSAVDAKPEKVVLEKDVTWEEYGLDKPEFTVTLYSKDDKTTKIAFGAANPAKSSYYARVDDQPKLLLVADTLKNSMNKTTFDLRDKSILTIPAEDVTRFVISRKGVETELKQEPPDRWVMIRPEETRVKGALVSGALRSVAGLSARDIIDEPKKDGDPYGLDKPEEIYTLTGADQEQTLEIGKPVESSDGSTTTQPNHYARVKGHDTVYVVESRLLKMMKTDPQDLKDRSVLSFNPNDIEKVDIELDGKSWVAVRHPDKKWSLEKPEKKEKMDSWLVSSLLWDLKDTEWKSLIKPAPSDLSVAHLDKPRLVAQFFKKDEKEPITLKAGWKSESKQDSGETQNQEREAKARGAEKKQGSAGPAETNASGEAEPETPKTLNAVAQPQEEKDSIMVLDGGFLTRLREGLKRLTEKD
jgi:hypothetical protein